MSCVCFVPEVSINSLSEISHRKVLNVFQSNFVNPKPQIVRDDIVALFEMLKYLREYYSYKMPPNDFLYDHSDNVKPDIAIPFFIRNCAQLASLHSELITDIARKHRRKTGMFTRNNHEYYSKIVEWYSILNCPRHPITKEYLLHYTDQVKMKEIYDFPEPESFITVLAHFTDEFRMYEGSKFPTFKDGTEVNPASFVYRAIHR